MATMTTGGIGAGFNIDQIAIGDLFDFASTTITGTTAIRVFDDAQNYTEMTGTGFASTGSPGPLTDVTAGTLQSITVVQAGVVILQLTGLSVSAAAFFDIVVANDTAAAWDLVLGGNDTITGTNLDDVLRGFAGNDTINAGNGNDQLDGGIGNDTLNGGNGDNFFRGDAGIDTYNGGTGVNEDDYDVLGFHGQLGGLGTGIAVVMNTAGVIGGGTITGTLVSGAVNSTFTHFERVIGTEGQDTFTAAAGFVTSSHADFNWVGGKSNDTFNNSSAADVKVNYDAEKFENQEFGNGNQIWGDAVGELGVIVNRTAASITVNVGGGNKTVAAGKALDTFGNTDTLTGTLGFRLTDAADYYAAGNTGALFVDGRGGNDTLIGGTGNDEFNGGSGNDVITAGLGDDFLNGGTGNDILNGGNGDNFYLGGAGTDSYIGGTGTTDFDYDTLGFHGELGGTGSGIVVVMNTTGVVGGGTITGTLISGAVNSTFSDMERIIGTEGSDSFSAASGFLNSANSSFNWVGGQGNDSFNNSSGSDVRVNYDAERFENFTIGNGNQIWGDAAGELGVIVNRSAASITVNVGGGNKTVAAGKALDTFGNTDTLTGTLGFRLTDAADYYAAGNTGALFVAGRGGNDTLLGGTGNDEFDGGSGNDVITAGLGDDYLNGGTGNDTLNGGNGDNFFEGGDGVDTYVGGTGTGEADFDKVSYRFEIGGTGIVATFGSVTGSASIVDTYGNTDTATGVESIQGSQYNDMFIGGAGNDRGEGLSGDDTFNFAGGGLDRVSYTADHNGGATHGVIVNMSAATISANVGAGLFSVLAGKARDAFDDTDTLINVERVDGTIFNDYIAGGSAAERLEGREGNDTLIGGGGADSLAGGDGDDSLNGGAGIDNLNGGLGHDMLIGGSENDTLLGGENNDTLNGGTGDDFMSGEGGNDVYFVDTAGDTVFDNGGGTDTVRTTISSYTLGDSLENLTNDKSNAAFVGIGNDLGNLMTGNSGNDSLSGAIGNDTLSGGAGNDTLDGGAGSDTVSFADRALGVALNPFINTAVIGGAEFDTILNFENFTGSGGNDILQGTFGVNVISGFNGDDLIYAFDGADIIDGGAGADVIAGGADADTITGGDGGDWLYGENGNDLVSGTAKSGGAFDVMIGGLGNDTLEGSAGGFDYFYGGAGVNGATGDGSDSYIVRAGTGIKVMNDFEAGGAVDAVRLLGTGFSSFAQVQAAMSFSGVINGTVLVVDAQTQIWFLNGTQPANLTAADFLYF